MTILVIYANKLLFNRIIVNGWIMFFIKALCIGFVSLVITLLFYARTEGVKIIFDKVTKFNKE